MLGRKPVAFGAAILHPMRSAPILDPAEHRQLVIFDGVCNLCEASVNFMIAHDPQGAFRFVPSQSALGQALQQRYAINTTSLDTVVLIRDGKLFSESEAAVEIAKEFDGPWKLLALARWVPRPLRDWAYRRVANNRYAWFGRKDVCMLPTPELRGRFLESAEDLDTYLR